jgi:hypothetical protein
MNQVKQVASRACWIGPIWLKVWIIFTTVKLCLAYILVSGIQLPKATGLQVSNIHLGRWRTSPQIAAAIAGFTQAQQGTSADILATFLRSDGQPRSGDFQAMNAGSPSPAGTRPASPGSICSAALAAANDDYVVKAVRP